MIDQCFQKESCVKIRLRELQKGDASGMYEWMTDPDISSCFRYDVTAITITSCQRFIKSAGENPNARHYAISNHKDEYLGTVSLKNIDLSVGSAEFAIGKRKFARGIGADATILALKEAFGTLNLKKVYLNVYTENERAQNCYTKVGFRFVRTEENAFVKDGISKDLNWYEITKEEFLTKHHG